MSRVSWQEYFMSIAFLASERSTCIRRKVGAIAVKERRILATGYNGAPAGITHCSETGCLRKKLGIPSGQRHEICRGAHAEQNVIIQAAISGVSIKGADIYCTTFPCSLCARMLINCDIHHIYFVEGYNDELSMSMFEESKVNLIPVKGFSHYHSFMQEKIFNTSTDLNLG